MDACRFPIHLLPKELYRVQYPGSGTTLFSNEGLVAADTAKVYDDEIHLGQAVVKQFTWSSREFSPFISLFSDREHAENWAMKEPWHRTPRGVRGDDWTLLVIDTQLLGDAWLYKVSQLVSALRLQIPDKAAQHIGGSFLCMHKIPAAAIIEERDSKEVKEDRHVRKNLRGYSPDYLYGSDSEREMLQENYNTIFEKNIEDGW
ncbi:hypothetical protein F53441_3650 [Fusarium austroafricanum]|uniref:DUF7587 domain-containing protein n=1 Tax=Fusarium austroafricanum TaxID=2364996 RepID=A0A8H4KPH4_9HYPO|nr:hypothetical protein F53441_3650 [Fusarium austroafricanum]